MSLGEGSHWLLRARCLELYCYVGEERRMLSGDSGRFVVGVVILKRSDVRLVFGTVLGRVVDHQKRNVVYRMLLGIGRNVDVEPHVHTRQVSRLLGWRSC